MEKLQFESTIENLPGFRADAVLGDTVYELLVETKDARMLRSALMQLSRIASSKKVDRAVLVVEEPSITMPRLYGEWEGAASVIRPDLFSRLSMMIRKSGKWSGIPATPNANEISVLEEIIRHETGRQPGNLNRSSEAYYNILRILIRQWMQRAGPVTSRWLRETAGCSYPTVANALTRLKKYLTRYSDRRVELNDFPRDEWFRLVANADRIRQTQRLADRSGQPRSPEKMLYRLQRLGLPDIAIGGVPGARRFFPALDLVGTPRLDLTIHTRKRKPDLAFLRKLDPALQPARPDEPASLVLHLLRQPVVFFETDPNNGVWADPVECLLDLHEMRLEAQAAEFLTHMSPK